MILLFKDSARKLRNLSVTAPLMIKNTCFLFRLWAEHRHLEKEWLVPLGTSLFEVQLVTCQQEGQQEIPLKQTFSGVYKPAEHQKNGVNQEITKIFLRSARNDFANKKSSCGLRGEGLKFYGWGFPLKNVKLSSFFVKPVTHEMV